MDILKLIWPTPFMIREKDVVSFVVQLVIFMVICAVVGWLISVFAGLPIFGFIFAAVGGLMGIYSFVGIVLCILKFLGLAK